MSENENLDDIQAYPVLTSKVSTLSTRRAGAPGASLAQTVQQALHEVLSWRPRASDPKGFVAALTQSFTPVEEEGRKGWEWTPHTYTIQADLGAVTGAQASIYKQATVILGEALPLLEGLKPLTACPDEENTEASRAIVESGLTELVDELGLVGGPRIQRVKTYFTILLGDSVAGIGPQDVGGQLGALRDQFGLIRDRVNTIQEEQNLTNYLVLADYVLSLKRSWDAQSRFFDRSDTDGYLGTQLVLLSRAMGTLVESVYEARDAMDSVFLSEGERQTISLDLPGGGGPITIAELLAWAERFGSEEAPRLIREGGKGGVRALRPTIDEIRGLSRLAWESSQQRSQNPVKGFHTPRVQRTWEEMTKHSDRIYHLVSQIAGTPLITCIDPCEGQRGESISAEISGEGFNRITKSGIKFGEGIKIDRAQVNKKGDVIQVEVAIADDAPLGLHDVTVTNPDKKGYTKKRAFKVIKGLWINSVEPPKGGPRVPFDVTIEGKGFDHITENGIDFGDGIRINEVKRGGGGGIKVNVTITQNTHPGLRDVTVTDPDGESYTKKYAFKVTKGLRIDSVEPNQGEPGELLLPVQINGEGFDPDSIDIISFGEGIGINVHSIQPDTLDIDVSIADDAPLGSRNVTVINQDGNKYTKSRAFKVIQRLLITSVTPNEGEQGNDIGVTIKGKGFDLNITENDIDFGDGIRINRAKRDQGGGGIKGIKVNVTITQNARLGLRDVTVTNPDGQNCTKKRAFEVIALVP